MKIVELGPHIDTSDLSYPGSYQSVSGKQYCIACSPDGLRVYLGGQAGVWRSTDGGQRWRHMERPQPPSTQATVPGALPVTNVYDLWVHPSNPDIVLAAVGRDFRRPEASGVYRSADGGNTWTLTHQFLDGSGLPRMCCSIAGAADTPNVVFAAGEVSVAMSADGGATWQEWRPGGSARVNHVLVGPLAGAGRRAYAFGSSVWFSDDSGATWLRDSAGPGVDVPVDAVGPSSRSTALHPTDPRIVYVSKVGDDGADELWKGVVPTGGPGQWTRLPTPLTNYKGTTASGCHFVLAHGAPDGQLVLFFSDRRTTHVAVGEPDAQADWQRVDVEPIHIDPHGMAASRDFRRSAATQAGRLHIVSDGGAYTSTDGARTWTQGKDLFTLGVVNSAILSVDGQPRGICIQTGDNSAFYSRDGGKTWRTQDYVGGDNDCTFADPRQPNRLIVFAPREAEREVFLYVDPTGGVPDASFGTSQRRRIKGPPLNPDVDSVSMWITVSSFYGAGYRPLVLTLPGEQPLPDGDFVTIWNQTDTDRSLVLRTTKMSSLTAYEDWVTTAMADGPGVKVFQQGPALPFSVDVVQASGGHTNTVFTAKESSGAQRVMRWRAGMTSWATLVPATGTGPTRARRMFVDPYRPQLIYVLEDDHVWRSDDGGARWVIDTSLETVLTLDGFSFTQRGNDVLLRDMAFDPTGPYRFAVGPRGVFHTLDGITWSHLALSTALAAQPSNLFYDPGRRPCDRSLYVSTSARGLLRLHPLPPAWDTPLGSVVATTGRITLLRVHDVATGFGPPDDRLDAEVIVQLDTERDKAFGFRLRADTAESKARAQLDQLRAAFTANRPVRLEYQRTGCRTGRIIRVIQT